MAEGTAATRRKPAERQAALSMRIAPATRDRLIEGAAKHGRSTTQEADRVLHQGLLLDRLAGAGLRPMMQVMAEFENAGSRFASERGIEGDWTLNPDAYQFATAAAIERLVYLTPGPWDGKAVHAIVEHGFNRAETKRAREAGYEWRIKE